MFYGGGEPHSRIPNKLLLMMKNRDNNTPYSESDFKDLDFSNLKSIKFVGDGTYMEFSDKYIEIRPSGTDAKTIDIHNIIIDNASFFYFIP